MEMTQINMHGSSIIEKNFIDAKGIAIKQMETFKHILIDDKIAKEYKMLDSVRIKDWFDKAFASRASNEIDAIFDYFKNEEISFYSSNLKTVDLIFNSLNDEHKKRIQSIYLENILKKLVQKDSDLSQVFVESFVDKNQEIDNVDSISVDNMFSQFLTVVVRNPNLSIDDSNDLSKLAEHYYKLYKDAILLALQNFLNSNNYMIINQVEEEMDKRKLRNGKTSAGSKKDKGIINDSLKAMENLLVNITARNKKKAKDELKACSLEMVDLIFNHLPDKYKDQKGLLDVMIDTNINERLGYLLESEIKKLTDILNEKNNDVISNELYLEKRHKQIEDYNFDFDTYIENVYKTVLHEISIAYDLPEFLNDEQKENNDLSTWKMTNVFTPEEEFKLKRLKLRILSESYSTKLVFKNMVESIIKENDRHLNAVITEMHQLSLNAYNDDNTYEQTDSISKK